MELDGGSQLRRRPGASDDDRTPGGAAGFAARATEPMQLQGLDHLIDEHVEEDVDISDDEGAAVRRARRKSSHADNLASRNARAFRAARRELGLTSDVHSVDSMSREERQMLAARYVDDALNHRTSDGKLHRPGLKPARVYDVYHNTLTQRLLQALAAAHMLLALWEPPSALSSPEPYPCLAIGSTCTRTGAARAALCAELAVLALYALEVASALYAHGRRELRRSPLTLLRVACTAVMLVDVLVALGTASTVPRFSRPLRAAVLASHSHRMRTTGRLVARAWRAVLAVVALLAAASLVFAAVAAQLVHAAYDGAGFGDSFGSVGAGFVTAHVLLTTENFPDAFYPATSGGGGRAWWWALFAPYEALGLYFLIPVLTAMLYETYREEHCRLVIEDRAHERRALLAAFRALDADGSGQVDFAAWQALLAHLRPHEPAAHVRLRFNALDRDRSGTLDALEFLDLSECLALEIRPRPLDEAASSWLPGPLRRALARRRPPAVPPEPSPPPPLRMRPRPGGSIDTSAPPPPGFGEDEEEEDDEATAGSSRRGPRHAPAAGPPAPAAAAAAAPPTATPARVRAWAVFRGASIAAQLAVLAMYGSDALGGPWSDPQLAALYAADKALLALYALELLARAAATTPRAFWRLKRNRFDAALLAASLVELLAFGLRGPRDSVQVVRSLRAVSFLPLVPGLGRLLATVLAARAYWLSLMASALAALYVFALVGMEAFGGLERPSGAQADFRSLPGAALTVFQLLTLSNWQVVMYEYAEAARSLLVALYFVPLATFCNQVVLSLLLAGFLDALRTVAHARRARLDLRAQVYEVSAPVPDGEGAAGPAAEPRVAAYEVRRSTRWERVAFDAEVAALADDEARALSRLCGVDLLQLRRAKADARAAAAGARAAADGFPRAPSRALSRNVSFSRSDWGSFYQTPSDAAIAQALQHVDSRSALLPRRESPSAFPPAHTSVPVLAPGARPPRRSPDPGDQTPPPGPPPGPAPLRKKLSLRLSSGSGGPLARAAAATAAAEPARVCVNVFPGDLFPSSTSGLLRGLGSGPPLGPPPAPPDPPPPTSPPVGPQAAPAPAGPPAGALGRQRSKGGGGSTASLGPPAPITL